MTYLQWVRAAALALLVKRISKGGPRKAATHKDVDISDVSVVIPARNEQHRITHLLSTLRIDRVKEVIVVNDQSSDDTSNLARAMGAKVIDVTNLPLGWVGKPWALQRGLEAATGEIVVCIDADVTVDDGAIERVVSELHNFDLVSLTTKPECSSGLEAMIHASLLTTLVYRFSSQPSHPSRQFINGQCFGFQREWLLSNGGFRLAAHNMTDDVALARGLANKGARIAVVDGSDVVATKMYESARQTLREWPRSLPMNDCSTTSARFGDTAFLWLTMVVPVWRLITRRGDAIDLCAIALRFATAIGIGKTYERKVAVLSPLADLVTIPRLTWTTLRPVRSWRARAYEPTNAHTGSAAQ